MSLEIECTKFQCMMVVGQDEKSQVLSLQLVRERQISVSLPEGDEDNGDADAAAGGSSVRKRRKSSSSAAAAAAQTAGFIFGH